MKYHAILSLLLISSSQVFANDINKSYLKQSARPAVRRPDAPQDRRTLEEPITYRVVQIKENETPKHRQWNQPILRINPFSSEPKDRRAQEKPITYRVVQIKENETLKHRESNQPILRINPLPFINLRPNPFP